MKLSILTCQGFYTKKLFKNKVYLEKKKKHMYVEFLGDVRMGG